MLTLLVVILHDLDRLPDLLEAWKKAKVGGVTIMQSAGGFHAESLVKRGGLAGLLNLFDQSSAQQRFIFSLIDDPEILEVAISEADRVVNGFDSPGSGILFTLPVDQALGLQKWRGKSKQAATQEDEAPKADKGAENLVSWFEEEIKNLYGRKTINEWKAKRGTLVSAVIKTFSRKPTIVQVDTPLIEVIAAFLTNPEVPLASVINNEERLVGLIGEGLLANLMLVPAMPDSFIQDPDAFEQAMAYAKIKPGDLACDVMEEPAFVSLEDSLEEAFLEMKRAGLPGLPVVDKHYRVKGYVTLLELLAVYFPGGGEKGSS